MFRQSGDRGQPFGAEKRFFPLGRGHRRRRINGTAQPPGFSDKSTGEGSTSMSFSTCRRRRALSEVARRCLYDERQLSSGGHRRNRRQPHHDGHRRRDLVQRRQGHPATPRRTIPSIRTTPGTPLPGHSSALSEIENPDPQPGTNNYYTQDGYGGGSGSSTATSPNANYGGGTYVNCADTAQPGVAAVTELSRRLKKLSRTAKPATTIWSTTIIPGYFGDGTNAYTDRTPATTSLQSRRRPSHDRRRALRVKVSPGRILAISSISI